MEKSHRQSSLRFDLAEAAYLLTSEMEDPSEYWLEKPVDYVATGFMVRCQRFIRGMATLVTDDLADVAVSLVRPTLESAITGEWLLDGGEANLLRLLGNDRRQLRQLRKLEFGLPDSESFDRAMRMWIGDLGNSELPSFRTRAGSRRAEVIVLYKKANPHVHVSYSGVATAFSMEELEERVEGHVASSVIALILDTVVFCLRFGRRLDLHLGWGHEDVFDELFEGLGASPTYVGA